MIISTDTEKYFDKVQHPFMIKNSQQSGHRGNITRIIKAVHDRQLTYSTMLQAYS